MIGKPSTYTIINLCFLGIIVAVIAYSLAFTNHHPIPPLLTNSTGIVPPSRGLSRAFSMIVRGNMSSALELNQHSIRIFMFFAIQLLMRICAIGLTQLGHISKKLMVTIDIAASILLFFTCFAPLISYTLATLLTIAQ